MSLHLQHDAIKIDWQSCDFDTYTWFISVSQYHVEVYTGDISKRGEDSTVTLQIFGERGDTGARRLLTPINTENRFAIRGVNRHFLTL